MSSKHLIGLIHGKSGIRRALLALGLVLGLNLGVSAQELIRIRGEDTMIFLAQRCVGLYQKERGNAAARFDIAGGGRTSGMTALAFGRADIAQTRSVMAGRMDSMGRRVLRLPVGIEFAVVYVNATNPVSELSLAQARAIFSGKVTNWKQVGGYNSPIHLLAGESTTGLEDFFESFVLQGATAAPFWGKSSPKELVDAVASDPASIGYTSLYQRPGARALRIRKAPGTPAVEPISANLRNHTYPIARFVYWYLPDNARPAVRGFAEWLFSPHGQLMVESVGYMPLLPYDRARSLAMLSGQASTTGMQ
jgi:phosphate transport system substrate-binding protein